MKILSYRTIAEVYPFLSLEAMVELDSKRIVYSNISVNGNKAPEEYCEDNHWTYIVPLTEVDWENVEDYYYDLTKEEDKDIHNKLLKLWNQNPIFDDNSEWKIY